MRKEIIAIVLILIFTAGISAFYFNRLPEKMASHWNAQGEADGWMTKQSALSIMPVTMIIITLLFLVLPHIDPLKENIQKAISVYYGFIVIFLIYLLMIQIHILMWNLGNKMNPLFFIASGIAVLYFYLGFMMKKIKRNWFIGIRTPWTLSSDEVWEKTHKKGAVLLMICGVLVLPGIFLHDITLYLILAPIIISMIYLTIYSYLEFKKEKNQNILSDSSSAEGENIQKIILTEQ